MLHCIFLFIDFIIDLLLLFFTFYVMFVKLLKSISTCKHQFNIYIQ